MSTYECPACTQELELPKGLEEPKRGGWFKWGLLVAFLCVVGTCESTVKSLSRAPARRTPHDLREELGTNYRRVRMVHPLGKERMISVKQVQKYQTGGWELRPLRRSTTL